MNRQMPQSAQSPSWSDELRSTMAKGWGSHLDKEEELGIEPREEVELAHGRAVAVFRDSGDVIFQFFPDRTWPPQAEARQFLAEVIEAHFGDTERFSASYVPELDSWAVKASQLANIVSYDKVFHVDAFIQLVDDTVDAL